MSFHENITFEKYHGAGNDFIFIAHDVLSSFSNLEDLKNFAFRFCNRNTGIGADGIVFYKFLSNTNSLNKIEILIINSDGSIPETCGNALRCLGLKLIKDEIWNGNILFPVNYIYPTCLENFSEVKFLQLTQPFAILKSAQFSNSNKVANVQVGMGKEQIVTETKFTKNNSIQIALEADPIFVQLANPHWVFLSQDFDKFSNKEFVQFGEFAQNSLRENVVNYSVPKANIGMLWQKPNNEYSLVVYERGAGLTQCCGSGGVAARIALEKLGKIEKNTELVSLKMPGGLIQISSQMSIPQFSEQRLLIGPAEFVYNGTI
ncbi:diaminopimelate epimerase [Pigmentibacter sp. JX0631]|uniref:diaminopimelate epimerase n=1 Tax=Pigmentibacter sp. JX0631 TaxID=2976982 RepID=UPI002469BA74|nr:diaminopimelate epimerase [Pigmentibacter sp. JX0631]WGL60068.1 diaminopimelate epimerase [Pigmentibacter sp. JX0631]